ncbi:MAG: response regulator transcription factor [Bacteroidota bacterium]|nr:response regulator transcription factor [Bacteroidota bacterium]
MTRIIIYEDNHPLCKSIQLLLLTQPAYEVVGSFDNANNAEEEIKQLHPDLVILDIDLPGRKGTEVVAAIKKQFPPVIVVMHTVFEEDEKLFTSLCAGANGYILKKTSPDKFLQYISEALQGGAPFSPSIAQKILKTFQQPPQPLANNYQLSDREKEVLTYLIKGYTYKAIAAELFISMDTVRKHVCHIYEKLHVSCGKEAVALAIRQRLV